MFTCLKEPKGSFEMQVYTLVYLAEIVCVVKVYTCVLNDNIFIRLTYTMDMESKIYTVRVYIPVIYSSV